MSLVGTIRKLIAKEKTGYVSAEIIPAADRVANIEENLRAITSMFDGENDPGFMLVTPFRTNDPITSLEMRGNIHLQNESDSLAGKLSKLEDELQDYNEMDEEMRVILACKIARLLPDLAESKRLLLQDYTIRVLKIMAQDEAYRVREMIAQELRATPDAPHDIVSLLAHDADGRVSIPILEFSPVLGDVELLEILDGSAIPGVTEAIARRGRVSEEVSLAIASTHNEAAITTLLCNDGAELSEQAVSVIVEQAPEHEIWHEPLLLRPELSQKTVNRIAGFISHSLLDKLEKQKLIERDHEENVRKSVASRLRSWRINEERLAELRTQELHASGRLTPDRIAHAIDTGREAFVIAGLSILSALPKDIVRRMIKSHNAKSIVALAWKSGLPMRTAINLQLKTGRIHHLKLVNAKDGLDYPMAEDEMLAYIEMFTD